MDGNIKDTPPIVVVPAADGPRRAGTRSTDELADAAASRSRPASRPPGPSSTSGSPRPSSVADDPADGSLPRPLAEGQRQSRCAVDGRPQP